MVQIKTIDIGLPPHCSPMLAQTMWSVLSSVGVAVGTGGGARHSDTSALSRVHVSPGRQQRGAVKPSPAKCVVCVATIGRVQGGGVL